MAKKIFRDAEAAENETKPSNTCVLHPVALTFPVRLWRTQKQSAAYLFLARNLSLAHRASPAVGPS